MARIIVISGADKGREYSLGPAQTIGRLETNEIPIIDSKMSRHNTRVFRQGHSWVIQDLESKNGTFLNGRTVEAATLSDNDEIRIGETWFTFLADSDVGSPVVATSTPRFADVEVATSAGSRAGGGAVSDRVISFSKHASEGRTSTSLFFLRQDLSQRDGTFRFMVFVGVALVAGGLFWLVQLLVVGT